MNRSGLVVAGLLLAAAVLPVVLLGVVRLTGWAAPAARHWEHSHRTGYSWFIATVYLLLAAGALSHESPVDPLAAGYLEWFVFDSLLGRTLAFGMFVAHALVFIARALRNQRRQIVAGDSGSA
jgi:hypothetical protein